MDNSDDSPPRYNVALAYSTGRPLRIIIAIAIVYAGFKLIGSTLVPPVYSVSTEEVLPANLADSWAALTDFAAYPQWNPYLPSIEGNFEVGETITLTLVTASSPGPRESQATVKEFSELKQFSWGGQFPLPGIAHTRHVFALEKIDEQHTRLKHFEEFRGLAVALDDSGREAEIKSNLQAFSQMNKALSRRLQESRQ